MMVHAETKTKRQSVPAKSEPLTATLRISPTGSVDRVPRDYVIAIELSLSDAPDAAEVAREVGRVALRGVPTTRPGADGPRVRDLNSPFRGPDLPGARIGVEAEVLCSDRPELSTIAEIRAQLSAHGYGVSVEERRACTELRCTTEAVVEQSRREKTPQSWYNSSVCGRHNYRTCAACSSVFRLVSSNPDGPAPAVHCTVCGIVLVEWGGTKLWEVELVTAGPSR